MKDKIYNYKHIAFHDIAVSGNRAWFCNIGYNALFEIDILTGITKLLDFFPGDSYLNMELYSPIAYLESKLYIAPRNGRCLLIYDLKKCSFIPIDLDFERYGEDCNYNVFSHAKVIQGKIYFFPGRFHAIVELDPGLQTISYIGDWYAKLSKNFFKEDVDRTIFYNIHVDAVGNCFLPCWKSKDILKINVCTRNYKVMDELPDSVASLSDAVEIEGMTLFSYKNGCGVWNYTNENLSLFKKMHFQYTNGLFLNTYKEWLYVVPLSATTVTRYNVLTGVGEVIYKFPDKMAEMNKWMLYKDHALCPNVITENRLAIYSVFDQKIVLIEMDTGKVRVIEFKLENGCKEIVNRHICGLMSKLFFYETEKYALKDFVSLIENSC